MLIVLGTLKLGDGALDAAQDAFAAMLNATRAEEGCIDYAFSIDVLDQSVLRITEKWVDDAALAAHSQTPHMAAFMQALSGLDVTMTQLAKYQSDEGSPLR